LTAFPPEHPWRVVADGLTLAVRVTPKGGRDGLDGVAVLADGRLVLKLRVRAAPEDGAANRAMCALLATKLRVAISKVQLEAGASSRVKAIRIMGDGRSLAAALEALTHRSDSR
jgi:uncharacterized protein (TIGR00251 family)